MAQFDPRRQPMRLAPHVFTAVAAVSVALLAGRIYQPAEATAEESGVMRLTDDQVAALEARAFVAAGAPEGLGALEAIPVEVRRGESFEDAVMRTGVEADDARALVATVANAFDVSRIEAGLRFETAVAKPRIGRGSARLVGMTMRTGPASQLTVSRSFDGALKVRALEEKVTRETLVATGEISGSLAASARRVGATTPIVRKISQIFAHKFDFDRDIRRGDDFTLVFDRAVTENGRTIETGDLLYAQIKGQVFYRFQPAGAREAQYFDATGKNTRSAFMRTPIDRARVSSSFGMRRHPIAGYQRMHQGIDFAAPTGTPIIAPADGVVVEARRWGGYGNWLRIRHSNGLETGYAHLSRYASGMRPGQRVRQGQVVAYVGSTGASTGPHLHYEVWRRGQRINPASIRVEEGTVLAGADRAAFRAEKARIDRIIAAGGERRPEVVQATVRGLRSVENAAAASPVPVRG